MTYSEKLKDPRWQKKRLEILNRDSFTCNYCGDTKSTLHVHHLTYTNGNNPWEYDDENFITLCCDCHQVEHFEFSNLEKFLWRCVRERDSDMDTDFRKTLTKIVSAYKTGKI